MEQSAVNLIMETSIKKLLPMFKEQVRSFYESGRQGHPFAAYERVYRSLYRKYGKPHVLANQAVAQLLDAACNDVRSQVEKVREGARDED